ncbi:MAG: endonuclease/exonuclease/phosphatase family protein [Bacteroidales bacterium]|nr:endonuclease/exonuclease/phosphatase family protein [Bacteroidales bacterium]
MAKKAKKKKNWFFGLTSRVLMLIVAALLLLSYLSVVINPAKVWPVSLSGIFFVPLMTLNLILLLWALKRKSRSFLIPLLALLPSFFFIGRYVQFNSDEVIDAPETDATVKVMTWNVGRFAMQDADAGVNGRSECIDSIFNFIKEQDADIICLQEFHISDVAKVRDWLRRKMKGYSSEYYLFPGSRGAFGNVTLSRFPVKGKGKVKFAESANLAIYTDYDVEGRHFRVYNCHFESYNISFSGVIRALAQRDSTVMAETGTKMKRSITRRPKQVDQVFRDIEKCPVEAFVCGDFNDNPMSYTYYRMTRGRKDAFVEAGDGFGATYSLLWPMLRIDYILLPDRFNALSHDIPRVPFSDHYPVITEIEL